MFAVRIHWGHLRLFLKSYLLSFVCWDITKHLMAGPWRDSLFVFSRITMFHRDTRENKTIFFPKDQSFTDSVDLHLSKALFSLLTYSSIVLLGLGTLFCWSLFCPPCITSCKQCRVKGRPIDSPCSVPLFKDFLRNDIQLLSYIDLHNRLFDEKRCWT